MNKLIKRDKKNELENTSGCCLNEQDNNNIDIGSGGGLCRQPPKNFEFFLYY